MPDPRPEEVLARQVYVGDRYKAYSELNSDDARLLAEEMSGHAGGGLEKHTAPVAIAWRELAKLLDERAAGSVAELDGDQAQRFAARLGVIPPGGSWL